MSLHSGTALLVECGLGAAVDGVHASWKAVLDTDASIARPPMTLVLVDGAVNAAGVFDGLELCRVESGMSDAGGAGSAALG